MLGKCKPIRGPITFLIDKDAARLLRVDEQNVMKVQKKAARALTTTMIPSTVRKSAYSSNLVSTKN